MEVPTRVCSFGPLYFIIRIPQINDNWNLPLSQFRVLLELYHLAHHSLNSHPSPSIFFDCSNIKLGFYFCLFCYFFVVVAHIMYEINDQ